MQVVSHECVYINVIFVMPPQLCQRVCVCVFCISLAHGTVGVGVGRGWLECASLRLVFHVLTSCTMQANIYVNLHMNGYNRINKYVSVWPPTWCIYIYIYKWTMNMNVYDTRRGQAVGPGISFSLTLTGT